MKTGLLVKIFLYLTSCCLILCCKSPAREHYELTDLSGPYLGQKPPGITPEIFAPGIISQGFHEHAIAISPVGDELFYVMADINYQFNTIIRIGKTADGWESPEVASFSGSYKDLGGCFSKDGHRFLFASQRPSVDFPDNKLDIWETIKTNGSWSEPVNTGAPVNSTFSEANPSLDSENNMYFQSNRDGNWNIWFSKYSNGVYLEPEALDSINTGFNESDPSVSPDGSYLLFHSNRNDRMGLMDIYVSFNIDGSWRSPFRLNDQINTAYSDFGPYISTDGKYLFFSSFRSWTAEDYAGKTYNEIIDMYESPRNGYATLYWVDANIIEDMRSESIK